MPRTPEGGLKSKIRKHLSARGFFWSNVKGGAHSKPGDPDMITCVYGKFLAIEAKDDDKDLEDHQETRRMQVISSWGIWLTARSVEDVDGAIEMIYKTLEEEVKEALQNDPEGFKGIEDQAVPYIAMGIRDPQDIRDCIASGLSPDEAWNAVYGA